MAHSFEVTCVGLDLGPDRLELGSGIVGPDDIEPRAVRQQSRECLSVGLKTVGERRHQRPAVRPIDPKIGERLTVLPAVVPDDASQLVIGVLGAAQIAFDSALQLGNVLARHECAERGGRC